MLLIVGDDVISLVIHGPCHNLTTATFLFFFGRLRDGITLQRPMLSKDSPMVSKLVCKVVNRNSDLDL